MGAREAALLLALLAPDQLDRLGLRRPAELVVRDVCCAACDLAPAGRLQLSPGDRCPTCGSALVTFDEADAIARDLRQADAQVEAEVPADSFRFSYELGDEDDCVGCGARTDRWIHAITSYPLCGVCYATAEAEGAT